MIDATVWLALHAVATLAMCGLIWFVQIVHYPLFAKVGESGFADFSAAHQTRTSWVVGPLMLVELGTALLLVVRPVTDRTLAWAGLALLLVIWLSTALVQVPCHRLLTRGFDERAIRRLVRTNWIRTLAWTARSWIALRFLVAG